VEKEYSMGVRMGKKIIENHTWTSNTAPVQKAKESTKGCIARKLYLQEWI
jgi:hypothetical protein